MTKSESIKSGWKPILESLQYTARSSTESIVLKTQLLVSNDIVTNHFENVFSQEDAFSELVGVFREITKNKIPKAISTCFGVSKKDDSERRRHLFLQ